MEKKESTLTQDHGDKHVDIEQGTSDVVNMADNQPENSLASSREIKLSITNVIGGLDAHTEKRLVRKIDRILMPIMCFTYAVQYYDKSVLSQAAIFGLREDLHLQEGLRYSNTSLIFYCGFIFGAFPVSLLAHKFQAAKVCSVLCFIWGAVVLTTPACKTYGGFLVNRFFLGVVESGVSPIFMMIISMWYTNSEQVLRGSIWYSCSGGSNLISPLINYGIGHIHGGALHAWQYMYLVAGIITLLWAIALWFIFPDSPTTAKGFSEEEKSMILLRIQSNNTGVKNSDVKLSQAIQTFLDWRFWAVCLLGFLVTTASGATTTFASIIFRGMGFNQFQSLLLNLPLGALAFMTILGSGYLGRVIPNSRHHIVSGACIPVILGCCLLWKLPSSNSAGRIAGFYLITFFGSAWTQIMTMGTSNVAGNTKKTIVAASIYVSYCIGNIVGPLLFDSNFAPNYNESFTGLMVCFVVAFFVAEGIRWFSARENKRRDEAYGPPGILQGLEDLTESENRDFRYQL